MASLETRVLASEASSSLIALDESMSVVGPEYQGTGWYFVFPKGKNAVPLAGIRFSQQDHREYIDLVLPDQPLMRADGTYASQKLAKRHLEVTPTTKSGSDKSLTCKSCGAGGINVGVCECAYCGVTNVNQNADQNGKLKQIISPLSKDDAVLLTMTDFNFALATARRKADIFLKNVWVGVWITAGMLGSTTAFNSCVSLSERSLITDKVGLLMTTAGFASLIIGGIGAISAESRKERLKMELEHWQTLLAMRPIFQNPNLAVWRMPRELWTNGQLAIKTNSSFASFKA